MAYKKLAILANGLYRKTLAGNINWKETEIDGVYQASLASYSVRISLDESEAGRASDVRISIVSGEGSVIESFTDEDLDQEWLLELTVEEHRYRIMYGIYETARRLALGSEKAVNDILSELNGDEDRF